LRGDVQAQFELVRSLETGDGVGRDPTQAVRWYETAAHKGHAPSQFALFVYSDGQLVTRDQELALAWCRKAALQGDTDAQFNLGLCYERGEGLAKDMKEAAGWYATASMRNDHRGQCLRNRI
jgi:TPR repeat protein